MSKIYDALQNAEADRTAQREKRLDTEDRGAGEPLVASSEAAAWWKGLIVGSVVGFLAAATTIPYLLERQRRSVPLPPMMERREAFPSSPLSHALVVEAPVQPTAQPVKEAGTGSDSETAPAAVRAAESLGDVLGAVPSERASPAIAASSPDAGVAVSPSRAFSIQVGAFKNRDNAVRLLAQLAREHHPGTIHTGSSAAAPWVLRVGRYSDRRAAEVAQVALAREGFPGFVVGSEMTP